MAVSRPRTGVTLRVLRDHRGAPICTIQSTRKEVTRAGRARPGPAQGAGSETGRQSGAGGTYQPFLPPCLCPQYGDFGAEGADLWLAASGDQRVSVWASDWPQNHCELVDWLSFPAPALTEVRIPIARWADAAHPLPTPHSPQVPGCLPPSLAAFCPWDGALLACVGLGLHHEVLFYSLRQKQACAPARRTWCWGGAGLRAMGTPATASRSLPAGGGEDPVAFPRRVHEPVPQGLPCGCRLCW